MGSRGPRPRPVIDRILERITIGRVEDCWLGSGPSRDGYYVIGVGSKADGSRTQLNMHSILYDLVVGDRQVGQVIDHLCRNRGCCNWHHMEAVDNVDNVMRGESPPARRARSTECQKGHEWTMENTRVNVRRNGSTYRRCRACERDRKRRRE